MAKIEKSAIQGIDEINKFLARLGVDAKKVAEEAMRSEARAVAKIARSNHAKNGSVDSGDLKKTVRVMKNKTRSKETVSISAVAGSAKNRNKKKKKTTKTDPFYAVFVEFGTNTAKAKPFMRPAFDQIKNGVADRAQEQLNKAAEKLSKKGKISL